VFFAKTNAFDSFKSLIEIYKYQSSIQIVHYGFILLAAGQGPSFGDCFTFREVPKIEVFVCFDLLGPNKRVVLTLKNFAFAISLFG